jgi:hypothetical protein
VVAKIIEEVGFVKKKILAALLMAAFLSSNPAFAIPEAKCNNPALQLNIPKPKVVKILGKPDVVQDGQNVYLISGSKDLMFCAASYRGNKVATLTRIYQVSVGIDELEKRMEAKGFTPLGKEEGTITYLLNVPNSDVEYYMVLTGPPEKNMGAASVQMTKEFFASTSQKK